MNCPKINSNIDQILSSLFDCHEYNQNKKCLMLSVANILAYEFQCDIHEISSNMKDDNDIGPIKDYLFHGKGSKLLLFINRIFYLTNESFQIKEFAYLLIDLLHILLKFQLLDCNTDISDYNEIQDEDNDEEKSVANCFHFLYEIDLKTPTDFSFQNLKSIVRTRLTKANTKKVSNNSDSDSESIKLNKTNKGKDKELSLISTSDDKNCRLQCNIPEKGIPKDLINTMNLKCFPNNFLLDNNVLLQIIIDIIRTFVKDEQVSLHSRDFLLLSSYPYVSFRVIEGLSSLFDFIKKEFLCEAEISDLIKKFFKLVFMSSCSLSRYEIGINLIQTKNVLSKVMKIVTLYDEIGSSFSVELVLGLIYILICVAQSLISTNEYSQIVKLIHTFISSGAKFIENYQTLMKEDNIMQIIEALSQLIGSLQISKILYVHNETCRYRKHTRCNLRNYLYHHNSILGGPSGSGDSSACCISSISVLILQLLTYFESEAMISQVIPILGNLNLCCCLETNCALKSLLTLLYKCKKLEISRSILLLIENLSLHRNTILNCCAAQVEEEKRRHYEMNSEEVCSVGYMYRLFITCQDTKLNALFARHIITLAKHEYEPLWYCVCSHVILPLFMGDCSSDVKKITLYLMQFVLLNNRLSKMFWSLGGLKFLFAFLKEENVSELAIVALETLLECEIQHAGTEEELISIKDAFPCLVSYIEVLSSVTKLCAKFIDELSSKLTSDYNVNNIKTIESGCFKSNDRDYSKLTCEEKTHGDWCSDEFGLKYVLNLWAIHSRLSHASDHYVRIIKSSFFNIITLSYDLFKKVLVLLPILDNNFNESIQENVYFIHLVDILELVIQVLFCMSPFSVSQFGNILEVDEVKLYDLLKDSFISLRNDKEDGLMIISKMIINSSLNYNCKEQFSSPILSEELSNDLDTEIHKSDGSCYEADDECYVNEKPIKNVSRLEFHSHKKSRIIRYQSLCKLVIDILAELSNKEGHLLKTFPKKTIITSLNLLLIYSQENISNRQMMCSLRISSLLLDGFYPILILSDDNLNEVQNAILILFGELCSYLITAEDLKLLFRLFKADSPPLKLLTSIVYDLMISHHKQIYPIPAHWVEFPQVTRYEFLNESKLQSWMNLLKTGKNNGFMTFISDSAICLPIPYNKNETFLKYRKFSLVFWISIETSNAYSQNIEQDEDGKLNQLHLISVTFGEISLEIWLNPEKRLFIFRCCKVVAEKLEIISSCSVECDLTFSGVWHHICFNFEEIEKHMGSATLLIKWIVDAHTENSIMINHGCPEIMSKSCIWIGTCKPLSFKIVVKFGNLIIFRNLLDIKECFYLYALGPDYCDFTPCEIEKVQIENIRIPKYFDLNKVLINNYKSVSPSESLKFLQKNVYLVYKVENFNYFLMYPLIIRESSTISINGGNNSIRLCSSKGMNSNESIYPSILFANVKCIVTQGMFKALVEIGGIGVLLFYFAKIVEISSNELIQAKALETLFFVCEIHYKIFYSFHQELNGLSLINIVLESPNCAISENILASYLRFCLSCDDPNKAIIVCSLSFYNLISAWRAWHRNPCILKKLYNTIKSLISDNNQFKDYNIMQMRKSDVVDILLTMLQETFLPMNENEIKLPEEVLIIIPHIIYSLVISTPIDISLLNNLIESLILLHQDSNTYICESSFYYLFTTNWRNNPINFDSKKKDNVYQSSDLCRRTKTITYNTQQSSLNIIMSSMIEIITKIINELPDELIDKVIGPILKPGYLLVLAHNDNDQVREEVLKCFIFIFRKGKTLDCIKNLSNIGCHLLANQLHQHRSSLKLIHYSLSFIMDSDLDFSLLDFHLTYHEKLSFFPDRFTLFFSLLPNSVYDKELCHNALTCLHEFLHSIPLSNQMIKYLFDIGFIECLAKVLILSENLSPCKNGEECDDDPFEENLINNDLCMIFATLSKSLFESSGSVFFLMQFQIIDMLIAFERHSTGSCSLRFRELAIVMFESILDCLNIHFQNSLKAREDRLKSYKALNKSERFLSFFPSDNIFAYSLGTYFPDSLSISNSSLHSSVESKSSKIVTLENLSSSELNERFRKFVQRSVTYLTLRDNNKPLEKEEYFSRSLLYRLNNVLETTRKGIFSKKKKHLWITPSKETIRDGYTRLVIYLLSPMKLIDERIFTLSFLTKNVDTFLMIARSDQKFTLTIEALLKDMESLTASSNSSLKIIHDFQTLMASRLNLNKRQSSEWYTKEIVNWSAELEETKRLSQKDNSDPFIFQRLSQLAERVSESAMFITRETVESQNFERKQFMNHLKIVSSQRYSIRKLWENIIEMFTHERGVWFLNKSYPQSWELDPTEGPIRIRRRLKRCHLNIPSEFFLPEAKHKSNPFVPHLDYLFTKDAFESDSKKNSSMKKLMDKLHIDERILYTTNCMIISPTYECPGEILIGNSCIYFVGEMKNCSTGSSVFTQKWLFDEIKEVNKCRYELKNNALEIFLIPSGSSYLISFESENNCEQFLKVLLQRNLPNLVEKERSLSSITQSWKEDTMTNFEYLTYLNKLSGRTFSDLMQYPVFPFILADYQSNILNLKSIESFRNLSRPIAVQKTERIKHFIEHYDYLKEEYERNCTKQKSSLLHPEPHHYGSHYSNSGIVLHLLVRLPPFTQLFLSYQGQSFDQPDRTFHSMATTWRLATDDSTTDFKELTPEFFYLPEFLVNQEKFDFGERHDGKRVNNVLLPDWCRNDPRLFILINRQALESDFVKKNINEWIDLIFGYKQTGKASIEAINRFHPSTYFGADASKIDDSLDKDAFETMIRTFGQMPRQLMTTPHPVASERKLIEKDNVIQVMKEVIGLKWGNYCGSPSENLPSVIFRKKTAVKIQSIVALGTNDVYVCEAFSCIVLSFSRQKSNFFNALYINSKAIISWNHPDNMIRIKYQRGSPSIPLLLGNRFFEKVTQCVTTSGRNYLMVGYSSGSIGVYTINEPLKMKGEIEKFESRLHGHYGDVKCISISKEFNVIVSGGVDGACISWDLDRLCYIRKLSQHQNEISAITISPTLCDVASLSHQANGMSVVKVNTINGTEIGIIKSRQLITAMCYSSAPEGISVNALVTAHKNGVIKFWSSWDLAPINELHDREFTRPIECLTFTHDNQYLYCANDEGTIFVWSKVTKKN